MFFIHNCHIPLGTEVCRDRRLRKALGQPRLSPTLQNHQHQPALQPGWPFPVPKGPEAAFPCRGGCSWSWGHQPQPWATASHVCIL